MDRDLQISIEDKRALDPPRRDRIAPDSRLSNQNPHLRYVSTHFLFREDILICGKNIMSPKFEMKVTPKNK